MSGGRASSGGVIRQSGLAGLAATAGLSSALLLDVAIAAFFGAGRETDAFFVAARIPLGLGGVLLVGANQALVPAISRAIVQRGEEATWKLISRLLTATVAAGIALVGILSLAAGPIMRVTAPGLDASESVLATSISRLMFAVIPLVAAAEILRALLNARYSFVAPAGMPVVLNGVIIGFVVAGGGANIHAIAWGYLGGFAAEVAILLVIAFRKGFRLRPSMPFGDPEVAKVGRHCLRPLAAAGLNPIARIGEQLFASFLPPGSISIINYGNRVIQSVGGPAFFRPLIIALLPRLTEATARGDRLAIERFTRLGLRLMLAVSIPLTAFMVVLVKPAVLVLFRRGNFSRSDATLLGLALAIYAASLVGSGVQRALLAPFYARLDTRTPLRNTVYGVAANLALLPILVLPLGLRDPDAILGIALAYSLAQYVNVAHAWSRLRSDIGMGFPRIGTLAGRIGIACAIATGAMLGAARVVGLYSARGRLATASRGAVVAAAGGVVLAVLLPLMGGHEVRHALKSLRGGRKATAEQVAQTEEAPIGS